MLFYFFKILIELRTIQITSKKIKRRYRRYARYMLNQNIIKQKFKNAKWGVSYSVFDGEELLEGSIKQIRSCVDYINVVYQDSSWNGKLFNPDLYEFLLKLKNNGLIDEIIYFASNTKIAAGINEINKRNLGLEYAKKAKCNYFMTMDTDEYYLTEEFKEMQSYIIKNNIDYAYCPIQDYGLQPTMKLYSAFYSVPLFAKINKSSTLFKSKKYHCICLCDSTRCFAEKPKSKSYFFQNIKMHHFSLIRKDLNKKFQASSCDILNKLTLEKLDIESLEHNVVENIFNINI